MIVVRSVKELQDILKTETLATLITLDTLIHFPNCQPLMSEAGYTEG